jgi:O-antigen ligase
MLVAARQHSYPPSRALVAWVALLVIVYPISTLVVAGAVNTVFFLLFLSSVAVLLYAPWRKRCAPVDARQEAGALSRAEAALYALSMASLVLSIFLSQWVNARWGWPYYDAPSRFLLSVPIFFALRRLPTQRILSIWWGFAVGAMVAAGTAHFAPHDWGGDHGIARIGTAFVNPIHFGDIALMLGVLPLFGLGWQTVHDPKTRLLFDLTAIAALAAGIYASILSGSRGGWVAVPVFLYLAYRFHRGRFSARSAFSVWLGSVLLCAIAYGTLPEIHDRVWQAISNLHAFVQGDENTSIGIRFQLWKAAWLIFTEHPIFGVGMGGFKALMTPMQQLGQLTPLAADFGRQEVHSEILSRLSQLGFVGFCAIVSIYCVPAWLFWRRVDAAQAPQRAAARMGVALVAGFFIFGLTVETFDLTMTAAFYALTTAVLLAATYPCTPLADGR